MSRRHVNGVLIFAAALVFAAPVCQAQTTGSITGIVVAQRDDDSGDRELVVAVPSTWDGQVLDGITVTLDQKRAKKAVAIEIPDGWQMAHKKGTLTFSGPEMAADPVIPLRIGLDGHAPIPTLDLGLLSGGRIVWAATIPPVEWPPVGQPLSTNDLVVLPQVMTPGETATFSPLDSKMTPPGGAWTINDEPAEWNGDLEEPMYDYAVGLDWKPEIELKISYSDYWGESVAEGVDYDTEITTTEVGDAAMITDCTPQVLTGGRFCVCGSFPDEASKVGVLLNGTPLGAPVSASSSVLNFVLPAGLASGDFTVSGEDGAGFGAGDQAQGIHIEVGGSIDQDLLMRGQSTPLTLWINGTGQPLSLYLWNNSPTIVNLDQGEYQVVTTSGGDPNDVQRIVHAVSPGDFHIKYQLSLGSCPCGEVNEWPLTTSTTTGDPCDELRGNCDALLARAEAYESWARGIRRQADYAANDQEWQDKQADWLDNDAQRDASYADTLRGQAEEWRQLAADARAMAARNNRRNNQQPDSGWAEEAARDEETAAERDAHADELEAEADRLDGRGEDRLDEADALRQHSQALELAAQNAEALAEAAREAYEECMSQLEKVCPEYYEEKIAIEIDTGDDPRDVGEDESAYCGPDVTAAYIEAMRLTFERMQNVPDTEKGIYDGFFFLKTNGWGIDQWPTPSVSSLSGSGGSCPSGPCQSDGNDKGQNCYTLFGQCVPGHVLNDIMYGFVADQVYVPSAVQDVGAHWAEAKFNLPNKDDFTDDIEGHINAVLQFADPAISQRSYELGDELSEEFDWGNEMSADEIQAEIEDGWAGFMDELKSAYPWLEECLPCPEPIVLDGWSRDWSTTPWSWGGNSYDKDGNEVDDD